MQLIFFILHFNQNMKTIKKPLFFVAFEQNSFTFWMSGLKIIKFIEGIVYQKNSGKGKLRFILNACLRSRHIHQGFKFKIDGIFLFVNSSNFFVIGVTSIIHCPQKANNA